MTGVDWQVTVVEGLLLKIWKYGRQFSQRKTSGKESSGMRVTSTKRYSIEGEERKDVWKKTEEFKMIMKFKSGEDISSVLWGNSP